MLNKQVVILIVLSLQLSDLINGKHTALSNKYKILDCRYPYEYKGGHIRGSVNTFTTEAIDEMLEANNVTGSSLIFHCEFSSQRAPAL